MSSLFGGGGPKAKQPTAALGLDIQTAEYGKCLSVLFGRQKFAGTVIWHGQFKSIKHKEKPAGSKGGGAPKQVSYTYTASYMLAMQEGVGNVVKVYDSAAEITLAKAGGVAFTGALGQAAWSNLAGNESVGYSGTVCIAFANKDLGDNPSLPNLAFEMDGLNQLNPGSGVYDADPSDIAETICGDARVGVNFTAMGDWTQWSNYCRAADLLFSPLYDTQQPALQVLSDLLKYSNSEGWYSEGQLKVRPRGDQTITGNGVTFTPDLAPVADLGPNDFITNGPGPAIQIKRKSPADSMNVVRIEHRDRAQKYRTIPSTATIDDDIVKTGVRAETSETVDMITRPSVGMLVATNLVNRDYYVRNEFEFRLSWRYCYLEPMDIVRLTDAHTGLNLTPVRILRITEDAEGLLSVEAEEMPEGIGHAAFLDPQSAAGVGVDPEADPGPVTTPYFFRAPNQLVSAGAPEIWVALAGVNPLWAGCDVFISHDGSSYTYHSTFARESTYGVANTALGMTADPYTAGSLNVSLNASQALLGCTAGECDNFVTLAMLDDELISYQAATLAAGPSYNLGTRIRRGGYGSAIAAHSIGAKFVRLDDDILRIPFDPSKVGQTIYVKFLSLNCFGRPGPRDLASETAYSYVIGTRSDFPDVPATPTGVTAIGVADGVSLFWTNPNPAVVGCTSIEYATSGSGPWTVLGQTGPTGTSYHHAHAAGTIYYYRLRARGHEVSGGWSSYSSTVNSAGYAIGGNGVNLVWEEYALLTKPQSLNPGTNPPCASVGLSALSAVADANAQGGFAYQATTGTTNPASDYFRLASTDTDYNLTLTGGKKYRMSFWAKASVAAHQIRVFSRGDLTLDGDYYALTTTRTRYSWVIDATAMSGSVAVNVGWFCNISGVSARVVTIDGVMIEQIVGNATEPSPFVPGSSARQAFRALTQGKGSGINCLVNSSFAQNTIGVASGAVVLAGALVADGWIVVTASGANLNQVQKFVTDNRIIVQVGNPTVPNGQNSFSQVRSMVPVDVTASAKYLFGYRGTQAYNGSSPPGGVTVVSRCFVQWLDRQGAHVSYDILSVPRGAAYPGDSIVTAPSNASQAYFWFDVLLSNASGSSFTHDNSVVLNCYFEAVLLIKQAVIDDEVADGPTYGRLANLDLYSSGGVNRMGLRISGSGHRVGAQRNLIGSLVSAYGSIRTTTALTATSDGVISVNAHSVRYGSFTVAYNAVANAITGLTQNQKYVVYCTDANFSGGTKTWSVGTSRDAIMNISDDIYIAGEITIPTSGSGSGGGGGGFDDCVDADMVLPDGRRAGDVEVGTMIPCWDYDSDTPGIVHVLVESNTIVDDQPSTRIVTESGVEVIASDSTPMPVRGAPDVLVTIPQMLHREVLVRRRDGVMTWELVMVCEPAGLRSVAHIRVRQLCYFAGTSTDATIATHNPTYKP